MATDIKRKKLHLIRIGLLLCASAIVLALLPRMGRTSYSYDLNQPWKYPLLTAPFDMPILRDSMTINMLRDSIDRHFTPFVMNDTEVERDNLSRFKISLHGNISPKTENALTDAMTRVYQQGVISIKLSDNIARLGTGELRSTHVDNNPNTVAVIPAGNMFTPAKAYAYVDSVFKAVEPNASEEHVHTVASALKVSLNPNIVVDTFSDRKFRNQEYLNVSAAQGIIKQGQRIVDRGEIITPQIYSNLRTYEEMQLQASSENSLTSYFFLGQALYVLTIFGLLYAFLYTYRSRFFNSLSKMTFIMTLITLFTVLTIILFENFTYGIYIMPFAAVPVILLVFFDSRTAIGGLITTVMLCTLIATFQFQFIFMQLSAGFAATFSIHQLSKRSQLLRTAFITFIIYILTFCISLLITNGNISAVSWKIIAMFLINGVLLSFAYVLIFLIEKIFGFTSTVTLVELSDINNPLLRELSEEAPGTFQHSMQVSTLAAEASRAIGANTQLVRTGALYHDIGKMSSPIFFTENQHGINPHTGLDPATSAQKIISHITKGLEMASKAKLPQVIKDFITQHHGRGLTRYFYNTECNNHPDKEIDPAPFTYPGPDPQSRETAILMMADAVEAASRSLQDYSPKSINDLVDKIIDSQIKDGRFNESPISFHDIGVIKSTFKKRLATIYHTRVAYPELKKNSQEAI